jgi:hypothetical protein
VLFMKEGVTGWLFRVAGGRVGAKIPAAVIPEPIGAHAASLAVPRQEAGR